MPALLAAVPNDAEWFVLAAAPEQLIASLSRLWRLLSRVPELAPNLTQWRKALAKWAGAFLPGGRGWRDYGLAGGGLAIAHRSQGSGGIGPAWLVLAHSQRPRRLLQGLEAKAIPPGRWRLILPGAVRAWCKVRAPLVSCSTDETFGASSPTPPLAARQAAFPAKHLARADLVFGRAGAGKRPALSGTLRLTDTGVSLRVVLQGGWAETLRPLLGTPAPLPTPPPGMVAGAYLQVAPGQLGRIVTLLPKRWQAVQVGRAPLLTLARLAQTSSAELWLLVSPQGWQGAIRMSGGARLPGGVRSFATSEDVRLYAQQHGDWLVVGSAAKWVRAVPLPPGTAAGSVARGRAQHRAVPPALGPVATQPVSGALWLPVTDPVEWLPPRLRAALIAAAIGLPEGERKVVALVRALLTLVGELGAVVRPTDQGIVVEAALHSPAYGPALSRLAFAKAWGEKWRTGGFYRPRTLSGLARTQANAAAGRLARAMRAGPLGRPWATWLAQTLGEQLSRLRPPEVDCTLLARRLAACEEAFGRRQEPVRWRELDSVVLWDFRRKERQHLISRARKSARSLTMRCDQLSGRLSNAAVVSSCLSQTRCAPFVTCLMAAFRPSSKTP